MFAMRELVLVSLLLLTPSSSNERDGEDKDMCIAERKDWTSLTARFITRGEQAKEERGGAPKVLGRRPHRLVIASSTGIHLSVKTAVKYHETRLPTLMLTWLQTVHPDQVHIITDDRAHDEWTRRAEKYGFSVSTAKNCTTGHCRECLCCKSGVEYEIFYKEKKNGSDNKWFCHVDDDMYVNVEQLIDVLIRYDPDHEKVYLGRWSLAQDSRIEISSHRAQNFDNLKSTEFAFATGALYCISQSLMMELESYLSGSERFMSMCKLWRYSDDMTIGATIEAILGYRFTNEKLIYSELQSTQHIPPSRLPQLVSISYGKITLPGGIIKKRHISLPHGLFSLEEDPTRFLSYHCLIHPATSWCH